MAQLNWSRDPKDPLQPLKAVPTDLTSYEIREMPNGFMVLCFVQTLKGGTFNHNIGERETEAAAMLVAQADWDSGKRQ